MPTEVTDNPPLHRYEIRLDGELAGIERYRLSSGVIRLDHTEVFPEFEGHGLAGQLVRAVLDDARSRGLAVLPFCPYVREFIAQHAQEYLDLVPAGSRESFGL